VIRFFALHHHVQEDEVMKMRPLEGGLALPVGHDVSLAPGGIHIMMMGLESPLEEGARHPLTLGFEQAGTLETSFVVRAVGAMTGPEE
jgi:copper(I)-binding protein